MSQFGESARGGFGGGRGGGFGQSNNDGQEASSSRGGRGGFGGGRGGGFNQDNQETSNFGSSRGGFGGGRGGGFGQSNNDGQDNSSGRGGFGGGRGRGGFNQDNQEGGRGGFGGGRGGGFGQSNNDGQEGSSRGGRGGFGGGRGNFNQDNQENSNFGSSRGGFGGGRGRGGFNQENQEGGRGGFGGGRGGGFNQENQEGGRGGFGGGRGGGFSQSNNDFQEGGRGGFGGGRGRGGFNQDNQEGGRGGFGGGRGGGFNQDNQEGGRGGFGGGRGRGGFNQENQEGGRGGFGGGRGGGFNQDNQEGGRGGFGGGRGRGGFNQDNAGENQENAGGFGGGRGGRGGGFRQSNDQEGSHRGGRGGFGGHNAEAGFDGENNQQTNQDGAANGENADQRAPINYVPQPRNVEELFSEDQKAATDYADVVDHDDEVVVENFGGSMVRIQKWEESEFEPQLLTNIKERSKYNRPRKIQGATIPFVLDGFDLKSQAETGSGKTAAFILPIIDACMKAKKSEGEARFESELASPYAIVIGPTRELVLQVFEQAEKFAAETGISVAKAYGQYNIGRNHHEIRCGCDILVATPGRLKHFVTNGEINVKKVKFLVLDEADRLLDQNFSVDIMDIVNTTNFPPKENRQTLLFSATFPPEVIAVANELLKAEAVFVTNNRNNPNKRIKQDFIIADRSGKLDKLAELLKAEAEKAGGADKIRRTLVFVNTKRMTDMAALYLCQRGIPATSINGDRGQHLREQALSEFRTHKVAVLCATDVCARGIDVKELDHVINMDLPTDAITYVHRIGRTGRICQGYSTTFVEGSEPLLTEIADMMRGSNEEVPEALKSVLGGGGASFGQSFAPVTTSANSIPVAAQTIPPLSAAPAAPAFVSTTTTAAAKPVAIDDDDEDW